MQAATADKLELQEICKQEYDPERKNIERTEVVGSTVDAKAQG